MLKDYLSKLFALALVVFACASGTSQTSTFNVDNATVGGDYPGIQYLFGPMLSGESGELALVENADGVTTGCDVDLPITSDVNGKIALVDRGACAFTQKVTNAEAAGAIAVIICNQNPDLPDDFPAIGGGDCDITIPAIGASYATCQTIRAEIANGVTVTMPDFGIEEGEFMNHEIELPGAGIYTAAGITSDTLLPELVPAFTGDTDATAGLFYTVTATQTGTMNVNSCLGGVDTDVSVLIGCRGGYAVIGRNDDACELEPGGNEWASDLSVLVTEGEDYVIAWTDRWSTAGFDFEVSFGETPDINVTFNVDMSNETVAADGVFISGTPTGGVETAMTDNGDGTWSYTAVAPAGSSHTWQYLNGTGNAEDAAGLEACGVDNGAGGFIRAATLNTLEDIVLPAVCYASCFACPSDEPTDCAQPFTLITENFDSYAAGDGIVDVSDDWINWPAPGVKSSLVSDEQALSGGLSLKLDGTDAAAAEFEDPILVLDGQISGNYRFGWAMYIPEGNAAYFNIQHFDDMFGGAQGGEWAAEMFLEQDGAGSISVESVSYPFSYPNGGWFDVRFNVDVTNDWVTMYINNVHVLGWQLSLQSNAGASAQSLGAINFYPRDVNDIYYVDDVYYQQIPAALDGNGYCHVATPIDLGVHTMTGADCFGGPDQVNAPAAAWYSYTAAEDGFCAITSCELGSDTRVWIFNSCDMRGTIGVNDDQCATVPDGTNLWASYKEFAVTAGETYYIAWDNRWLEDGETHDFELIFFTEENPGDFCQTAIDIDLGTHSFDTYGFASQSGPVYGAGAGEPTPYTRSKWFTYTPDEDILVRLYSCDLAVQDTRAWIYVGECGSYESLQLVVGLDNDCGTQEDFTWDAVAGTTYYIEWDDKDNDAAEGHEFALEEVILETVSVTYQVDMSFYLANGGTLETIKIAGNFATNGAIDMVDWDPTQSPAFTDIGDDIFETTIQYLVSSAGQDQLYKYLNTADSWGACGIDQECFENAIDLSCTDGTADNNRIFTIPSEDATVCFTFDYCTACNETATREQLIDIPMTIAPNPFSQEAIVTFNEAIFEAEASLTTLTGQVARTYQVNGTQLIIEKENLSPGVYFFTVTTAEGVSTAEKLIVQ